jgi:hypothetical protein
MWEVRKKRRKKRNGGKCKDMNYEKRYEKDAGEKRRNFDAEGTESKKKKKENNFYNKNKI